MYWDNEYGRFEFAVTSQSMYALWGHKYWRWRQEVKLKREILIRFESPCMRQVYLRCPFRSRVMKGFTTVTKPQIEPSVPQPKDLLPTHWQRTAAASSLNPVEFPGVVRGCDLTVDCYWVNGRWGVIWSTRQVANIFLRRTTFISVSCSSNAIGYHWSLGALQLADIEHIR